MKESTSYSEVEVVEEVETKKSEADAWKDTLENYLNYLESKGESLNITLVSPKKSSVNVLGKISAVGVNRQFAVSQIVPEVGPNCTQYVFKLDDVTEFRVLDDERNVFKSLEIHTYFIVYIKPKVH